MDEHIFDKVQEVDMQKTMKDYYIDYAMSVIASRALPDVRDGLKPVQIRPQRNKNLLTLQLSICYFLTAK